VKQVNLSEWAVTHRSMVLFLILAVMIAGLFSYTKLGRLEDPNFNVPFMTAMVVWPGASAEQVQNQVMNRMERNLRELEGFDYVRTFSRQGYGALSLAMDGGMSGEELDEAWYQARKKIGDNRQNFPSGVLGPYYNDEFTDVYMSLYAVQSDDLTMAELLEFAQDIKLDLQRIPTLNKVDILGQQQEKIYIDIASKRIAALGMTPQDIISALERQNLMLPAGTIETDSDSVFVRVDGALHDATDVANTDIAVGNRLIKLSDIAEIHSGYEDPPSFTIRHNGKQVLVIGITMTHNANILRVGEQVDAMIKEVESKLPAGITLEKYADQPEVVAESVWEFERAFLEALAIVLAVSFFTLGRQAGIVVAASVPLVLSIVLIVMYVAGWNLDRISLGSLIIALGLLVDDAIIAVEMMILKMEEGWDKMRAATYAYTSTAFPMLTGTLVTVAGFMPVGFAQSISGQYAGGIFWVVGIALIASWFVAVVFTPYLGIKLLPDTMVKADQTTLHNTPRYRRLHKTVDWCVGHRWCVIIFTVILFISAGIGMSQVQQQFFPTTDRPELMVELHMKEGSSFNATAQQVKIFEQVLANDPDIDYFTVYTGAGTPRFYLSLQPELPNPGYANVVIMTSNTEKREQVLSRLTEYFNDGKAQPAIRGRVLRLEFGPPVGFPVQFRILGPDADIVKNIAYQVRDIVSQSELVRDTQLNWNEQVRTLKVNVDHEKAQLLGLSSADISHTLQTVYTGATITQVRRHETLIDVVLRADSSEYGNLESLADINVFSTTGQVVPLSQIATIEPTFEEPVLWRWNRNMAITVRSDLTDGVQGPYATQQIWPSLKTVIDNVPLGYRIEQGGAIEESDKSNKAILAVFPAMFIVMLTILMIQLQSFSRMFMVFITAPLGLIGVVPALLVFNAPFGFVALLGVIALSGMIMRNSVILVDQIEQDIKSGMEKWQAIVYATVRRTRPVTLTAAAAILAMIPLSRSIFWGPMAISIMGGLIVATVLTLGFVPALYAAWFKVKRTP
jgi:multidrug efflux pump